jgi:hypothetical protein
MASALWIRLRAVLQTMALAILALFVGTIAMAQSADEWRITQAKNEAKDGSTVVIVHNKGDMVVVVAAKSTSSSNYNADAGLINFAKGLPKCGTGKVTATPNGKGRMMVTNGAERCIFMTAVAGNTTGLAIAKPISLTQGDIVAVTEASLFQMLRNPDATKFALTPAKTRRVATTTTPQKTVAPPPVKTTTTAPPKTLKAAMDAIPDANRPIGMASVEGEWDSYNATITFDNYMLFPGGYAINSECAGWNAMKPPSAQPKCSTVRYTKLGPNSVRIGGENSDLDLFQPFRAGEMVNYDYGNIGGGGASTYGGGTSQISGSGLKLTPSGKVTVSNWTGTTVSGSNFTGYSSNRGGISGTYYLDGYMIAIQDQSGTISIGFIAKKDEGRDRYLYLNGELFWK